MIGIVFPFSVAYNNGALGFMSSVTGWVLQEAETELGLGELKAYYDRKREETGLGRWSHQPTLET